MRNQPRKQWYDGATVMRLKTPAGQTSAIRVSVPRAYGHLKSCEVRPDSAAAFMADVIEGLLYELDKLKGNSNGTPTQR